MIQFLSGIQQRIGHDANIIFVHRGYEYTIYPLDVSLTTYGCYRLYGIKFTVTYYLGCEQFDNRNHPNYKRTLSSLKWTEEIVKYTIRNANAVFVLIGHILNDDLIRLLFTYLV